MHDPDHVAFSIRRPWPQRAAIERHRHSADPLYRHRQFGPLCIRASRFECAHCDEGKVKNPPPSYHKDKARAGEPCPDCLGRGYCEVPLRRRLYWSFTFMTWRGKRYYFPDLLTIWHHDPQTDGSDSSCRHAYVQPLREAALDGFILREWWWSKKMAHYDKWHVHHWQFQFHPWQKIVRRIFTRCEYCHKRFPYGYSPMSLGGWDAKRPDHFWQGEDRLYHHGECEYFGHRDLTRQSMSSWIAQWGEDEWCMNNQREREIYEGDQGWWRQAILGEAPDEARRNAMKHPLYGKSYEKRMAYLNSVPEAEKR